jgi:hypothetical protein
MQHHREIIIALLLFIYFTSASRADEGVSAAIPWRIEIDNATDQAIICETSLAHWYSAVLGRIEPGLAGTFELNVGVRTGTIFLKNEKGDGMPIQEAWCGYAGDGWATRSLLDLPRHQGSMPADLRFICRASANRVACGSS